MNSQLVLLLLTLLVQNPPDSQVFPQGFGGPAAGQEAEPAQYGYGVDKYGKYCMVIQISPAALLEFAKGDQGNELFAPIPIDRRNHLDGLIFRVGTGALTNSPPPTKISDNRMNPGTIKNLVQVDQGPNALLTNASQSGNSPAVFPPAGGNAGNAGGNVDTSVMPSNVNNIMPDRRNEPESLGPPHNNTQFGNESSRQGFSFLKNNPTNTNPSSTNAPQTNPSSYGASVNGQGFGTNDGNFRTGQSNLPNQTNASNLNGIPLAANNSNPNSHNFNNVNNPTMTNTYGQSNAFNTQSPPFYNQPPLLAQNVNQGLPPHPQMDYRTNQFPTQPSPSLSTPTNYAGQGNPKAAGPGTPATTGGTGTDEQTRSQESVLPFLLLFSLVGNVYLGLWMSHLRKRYRELRSSTRGIPISELN